MTNQTASQKAPASEAQPAADPYRLKLSRVSLTAIPTLTGRAVEAGRQNAAFYDPLAILCLERLEALVTGQEKRWLERVKRLYSGFQAVHARALVQRAQAFDRLAGQFIAAHPAGTLVNLACGFDTRYWRLNPTGIPQGWRYIELDLPDVTALKRELLAERLCYELIGCSVLDESWLERVTARGSSGFLLLAEGLFMYLPEDGVACLLQMLARRLERSELVLDITPAFFARGLWKKLIALDTRLTWGLETNYVFGVRQPRDLENYAQGIRFLDQEKGGMGIGSIVRLAINPG